MRYCVIKYKTKKILDLNDLDDLKILNCDSTVPLSEVAGYEVCKKHIDLAKKIFYGRQVKGGQIMTKLEAINKIRKLPELKDGYIYEIDFKGCIIIKSTNRCDATYETLFDNFSDIVENKYYSWIGYYEKYFSKPIIKSKEKIIKTTETEIVGYE